MHKLVNFFLDLIFPKYCLNCHRGNFWLCSSCWEKLKLDLAQSAEVETIVEYCDEVMVVSSYDNLILSKLLHCYKYKYITELSGYLAELAIIFFKSTKMPEFDFVIPIPLSNKRELERGFNQSELVAELVGQEFGWSIDTKTLIRKLHTRPQVGLNAQQRLLNVQDIFSVTNKSKLKNKKILLVDDVVTTGATMRECAKLLKQSGATAVYGLVLLNR